MAPKKGYRRGYPVAMLAGLKEDKAIVWKVYSNVIKPEKTVPFEGFRNDAKALYNFHEAIINALRPTLKEGVKSIILASPARTSYATDFLRHIREHHAWLFQGPSKATFAEMTGTATTLHEVTMLTRAPEFRRIIGETAMEETENLIALLEKRLNASSTEPLVLYSLGEIEDVILGFWKQGKPQPEVLMIADTYLSGSRQRNRLQRLMQIAANRGVKTKVVSGESAAGKRLLQLGGIVCVMKTE